MVKDAMSKDDIWKEITFLEEHFKPLDMPIVFSHHDIHNRNAIYNPETGMVIIE